MIDEHAMAPVGTAAPGIALSAIFLAYAAFALLLGLNDFIAFGIDLRRRGGAPLIRPRPITHRRLLLIMGLLILSAAMMVALLCVGTLPPAAVQITSFGAVAVGGSLMLVANGASFIRRRRDSRNGTGA